jgi:hypothetical protein
MNQKSLYNQQVENLRGAAEFFTPGVLVEYFKTNILERLKQDEKIWSVFLEACEANAEPCRELPKVGRVLKDDYEVVQFKEYGGRGASCKICRSIMKAMGDDASLYIKGCCKLNPLAHPLYSKIGIHFVVYEYDDKPGYMTFSLEDPPKKCALKIQNGTDDAQKAVEEKLQKVKKQKVEEMASEANMEPPKLVRQVASSNFPPEEELE